MYERPAVAKHAVFRGGTALHKLWQREYTVANPWFSGEADVATYRLAELLDALFLNDITPLLRPGLEYEIHSAWDLVHESLVRRLPGEPWKGAAT